MDRRKFLSFLGAGVAGFALEQAIPFGRVWSFPKEIVIPNGNRFITPEELDFAWQKEFTKHLAPQFWFRDDSGRLWLWPEGKLSPISASPIKDPEGFRRIEQIIVDAPLDSSHTPS